MVHLDARHEYTTIYRQAVAMEELVREASMYLNPRGIVYVDDEEEWIFQSVERAVEWRRPVISMIQLKREALQNLRWIASLNANALAGIPPP